MPGDHCWPAIWHRCPRSSPLGPWLTIWAFFLFLAVSFIGMLLLVPRRAAHSALAQQASEEMAGPGTSGETYSGGQEQVAVADPSILQVAASQKQPHDPVLVAVILALVGLAFALIMLNRPTAAMVVLPFGVALLLLISRRTSRQDAFVLLLIALGLGILGSIEPVYLRDFLDGGDWSCMNTVFKFGMPAWLLLGLAGSVMLPRRLARNLCRDPRDHPGSRR